MSGTKVQEMVDATRDMARTTHPCTEFSITLSRANSLLLPLHDRQLNRVVQGHIGYYGGHVYRDAMVWDVDMSDWLIAVTPVRSVGAPEDDALTYYGDLRTDVVSTVLTVFLAPVRALAPQFASAPHLARRPQLIAAPSSCAPAPARRRAALCAQPTSRRRRSRRE